MTRPAEAGQHAPAPPERIDHLRPTHEERHADQAPSLRRGPAKIIGATAMILSALYFLSDVIEVIEGGFSTSQLWLTLIAEAGIPIFVVGLAGLQRPHFGRLGMISASAYACSYVFFTATVVYALVNNTKDYQTLSNELGALMIAPGALMVFAGLGFGYAVLRARVLPAWTGVALMAGVVLVALAQSAPDGAQLAAAGVRALGLAGMGAALLRARTPRDPLSTALQGPTKVMSDVCLVSRT